MLRPELAAVLGADRFVQEIQTTAALPEIGSRSELVDPFGALQDRVKDFVTRSNGADVARLKIQSPFAEKLKYSMYSALRIIPVHQRRHLWQAEKALEVIESGGISVRISEPPA